VSAISRGGDITYLKGCQKITVKICEITAVSLKNWKNHGKITLFNNINKSSIKESYHAHSIHKGPKCHENEREKILKLQKII